jgi:hypothetical protein
VSVTGSTICISICLTSWTPCTFSTWLKKFFQVFKILCGSHGARSKLNSVFGLEKVDQWNPIRTSAIQSRSCPMWFLGFSNYGKGTLRQEILKWSIVCSTFLRHGWSIVRSASLAKGGTSKKRPSPHLHKVLTQSIRWVHELCKQPLKFIS